MNLANNRSRIDMYVKRVLQPSLSPSPSRAGQKRSAGGAVKSDPIDLISDDEEGTELQGLLGDSGACACFARPVIPLGAPLLTHTDRVLFKAASLLSTVPSKASSAAPCSAFKLPRAASLPAAPLSDLQVQGSSSQLQGSSLLDQCDDLDCANVDVREQVGQQGSVWRGA